MDETKGNMETLRLKDEELMKDYIKVYIVEFVIDNSAHVKTCAGKVSGRFQELEKSVQEEHTT
jgi:hypothetical protein